MHLHLVALWTTLRARWETLRQEPEAGYTTETVLVTAALVVIALAVLAVLAKVVIDKANSIQM
jgi:hypothetical protein